MAPSWHFFFAQLRPQFPGIRNLAHAPVIWDGSISSSSWIRLHLSCGVSDSSSAHFTSSESPQYLMGKCEEDEVLRHVVGVNGKGGV